MDRSEARAILESMKLIDFRFAPKSKTTEALDLAIEALKGDLHCPKCGTIVRDGRQYHDLVYRGEAEQVTSKLKNPDDSLLTDDSDECKEQKSKLDCISRADAIAYIDRIINTGLGKNKSLDYIRKYISALPSAETHEIRTETHGVCSDCISRQQAVEAVHRYFIDAIDKTPHEIDEDGDDVYTDMKTVGELLKHNKHISKAIKALSPVTPTVKVQQADTLIIASALWYFAQDSERNIPDRERAEELRKQVLAYGASMCKPVTPTEKTGEWEHIVSWTYKGKCTNCGFVHVFIDGHDTQYKYCPNCGAKMGGDSE